MFDFVNVPKLVEKAIVTFLEAAVAFLALNSWNISDKTVQAGAVGAGLSAVYNLVKQYKASK